MDRPLRQPVAGVVRCPRSWPRWSVRAVAGALLVAAGLALTSPPSSAGALPDADSDGIPDDVECAVGDGPNLLVNGGFELPAFDDPGYHNVPAADMVGWTTTGTQFEVWPDGFLGNPAAEGGQYIELNSSGPDAISQETSVNSGLTYRFRFAHRGRNSSEHLAFHLDGASSALLTGDSHGIPGQWRWMDQLLTIPAGETAVTVHIESLEP